MKTPQYLSDYIDQLGFSVRVIRFFALAGGLALIGIGHYFRGSNVEWQASISDTLFWVGLVVMLITNLLLVFIDKQPVEVLKSLHEEEEKSGKLEGLVNDLRFENKALISWNALTKVNFELLDRALMKPTMDQDSRSLVFNVAVECIAERKHRLFGIEDDYLNISVYEYSDTDEKLHCIACHRGPTSDAGGQYRSWKIGEGHVGRTFQSKRGWVCADTRDSSVANWFEPSLENRKDTDRERYISLISVPIAIDAEHPLGVIIVTSNKSQRFVNRSDVEIGSKAQHPTVESLQDIASQLAPLMCILKVESSDNGKGQNNEAESSE